MKENSYFKLPFKKDGGGYTSYAWTSEGEMALTFSHDITKDMYDNIIETINGDMDIKIPNLVVKDEIDFYSGDTYLFCVRGWGALTSSGLSREDAAKVQDDFVKVLLEKLKLT